MPPNGPNRPNVRPYGYQDWGAPRTDVSTSSTNQTTHPFLRDGNNPSSISIEDLDIETQLEEALVAVEKDDIPPAEYAVKLEIPMVPGETLPIGDEIIERLRNQYSSKEESFIFKESGCIDQFMCTLKFIGTPLAIFKQVLAAAQLPYRVGNVNDYSFLFKFSEDNFFHKRLLNQMDFAVSSVQFGTLLPNQTFQNHWTISYENERLHPLKQMLIGRFKARFLFDEKHLLSVDVWNYQSNRGYKKPLEYFMLSIDKKQVQRLILSVKKNEPTALYLELAWPASIAKECYEVPLRKGPIPKPYFKCDTIYRGRDGSEKPAKGVLAENKFIKLVLTDVSPKKLYLLLSRFTARTHIPVEVGQISSKDVLIKRDFNYIGGIETLNNDYFYNVRLNEAFPNMEDTSRRFQLTYLLMCLYSMGAIVKDQIGLKEIHYSPFIEYVLQMAQDDFSRCSQVLEALVRFLNMRKKHKPIMDILVDFYESARRGDLSILPHDERLTNAHFEKIGLVVLTPTRVLFKCPEIHMGNTVTRFLNDNTRMLRIIVREDDGSQIRCQNHGETRFRKILVDKMEKGIEIYGRKFKFFGSSGSQQREMGMYFMDSDFIEKVWKHLGGIFSNISNMYKRLAREGQSLSQSMRYSKKITREMWGMTKDYKGGKNRKGEEYCFSDGCGMISHKLMEAISEDLKLATVPCAIQFRFLGCKGMLAVNPFMLGSDKQLIFRDSQFKFGGREEGYLELVKPAMPQLTNLSRPFINILCQNATNSETHERILNRLLDLYEIIFKSLAHALTDEKKFREVLKELPYLMDVDFLSETKGFVLSQEPFFRSLVIAYVKQKLHQQINKISLPMPAHLGRSMFGVVDETGLLAPGQVFVQWSKSLKSNWNKQLEIVEGKVTVTKNPCLAAGDVRVFTAVNIPVLAEIYHDVIVFPNYGKRPHPDEMAGSDLDGDEYTVLRDDELLLDGNEQAFDFVADGEYQEKEDWKNLSEERRKIEHVLDFFQKNKIGVFADAQMDASDMYGINSTLSKNLIKKTCMAQDFAKSGIPPADLTREPTHDDKEGAIPPESSTRKADFKGKDENGPTYASQRINGILHRSNRQLASLITAKENDEAIKKSTVFEELYIIYSQKVTQTQLKNMKARVALELENFIAREKGIPDNYGIATEAEIFSNCILQMVNKLCERDEDDGSNFTTANIIQRLTVLLFKEFREKFFEEFEGGWYGQTEYLGKVDPRYDYESMDVMNRRVKSLKNAMVLKAVLYYKLCYDRAILKGQKFLAFGWLAADVLAKAQDREIASNSELAVEKESFHDELERAILATMEGGEEGKQIKTFIETHSSHFIGPYLRNMLKRYGKAGFIILLVLKRWAILCGLITASFPAENFLFLIMFVSSSTKMSCSGYETIIEAFDEEVKEREEIKIGKALAKIMERLGTRKTVELGKQLTQNSQRIVLDWNGVYEAARKSFLTMSIYQRFDELIGLPVHLENVEKDVLIIELPVTADLEKVRETLLAKTGVEELTLRRKNPKRETYVTLLFRGNSNSEEKLRSLVQLPLPVQEFSTLEIDKLMPKMIYNKIMGSSSD